MSIHINGKCPHCQSTFEVKDAVVVFVGNHRNMKVSLIFALCPNCCKLFNQSGERDKAAMIKNSFHHVFNYDDIDWTVTNSLSLEAHWGDFFNAWLHGINIPKIVFDAINEGLVDEVMFSPPFSNGAPCK